MFWMTRRVLALAVLCVTTSLGSAADNQLTEQEQADGWKLLFDGHSTQGWISIKQEPIPLANVQDGSLNPHPCNYMLVYENPLTNYVLSLDFKISKGCNSGIFFRTSSLTPKPGYDVGFNGIEVAIDDTTGTDFHDTGAIYDLVKPKKNTMKPAGEWNRFVLTSKDNLVTIDINGERVNEIDFDQWPEPGQRPDGSKHKFNFIAYKNHPRTGYIGLQDHGSNCWYRNIKLKVLE